MPFVSVVEAWVDIIHTLSRNARVIDSTISGIITKSVLSKIRFAWASVISGRLALVSDASMACLTSSPSSMAAWLPDTGDIIESMMLMLNRQEHTGAEWQTR